MKPTKHPLCDLSCSGDNYKLVNVDQNIIFVELPWLMIIEQDALMSPNPREKLEDLAAGCVCVF